jgi:urea transport system ATP-binding protein
MLSLEHIEVSIGGSQILRGVNFNVPPGSVTCLMGRNGVGKTTTLRTITGLLKHSRGNVLLDGINISKLPPEERARAGIGYVPQGREIFPQLSVEENLHIGCVARGKSAATGLERVFALFPILKEFLPRKGGMLSGGQQQQLAIGRALLTNPKLLILDEPTEGIQPNVIDQIGDTIRLLRKEGAMSILLVEQYLEFAKELADRFCIMDRGTIVSSGTIEELSESIIQQHLVM